MSRRRRLFWTFFAAALAFIPGCIGSWMAVLSTGSQFKVESVPLPHHVPKSANAASFRFAMAHDVIHERFYKHGPAFYRERERLAREKLAHIPADSDEAFGLYDDIGTGLDRLGKPADAIPILKNKLELQKKRGLSGRDLYTTYANLGTFIIHANMPKAIAGDAPEKAAVADGLSLLKNSVGVNPEAHFGREVWQIVLAEFLLAASADPSLLAKFDFVGNRIDLDWKSVKKLSFEYTNWSHSDTFGRTYSVGFPEGGARKFQKVWHQIGSDPDRLADVWAEAKPLREYITMIGGEEDWSRSSVPSHRKPVAFDEPLLGIIGMWRQGGGGNPHFCLCIGEIMLRVGQRRIAWTAYERAKQFAPRICPKPKIQKAFRDHCDQRQKEIEQTLPADEVAALRPKFDEELAYGLKCQKEYQDYEAARIAAGADIADEHFFDEFQKGRPPIASPTGPEEWYVFQKSNLEGAFNLDLSGAILFSGFVAFLTALWLNRTRKRKSNL